MNYAHSNYSFEKKYCNGFGEGDEKNWQTLNPHNPKSTLIM